MVFSPNYCSMAAYGWSGMGRQALLFHMVERKFYIFGIVSGRKTLSISLLLIISAYALFLVTAIAGQNVLRLCLPADCHTNFSCGSENWVEGDRNSPDQAR